MGWGKESGKEGRDADHDSQREKTSFTIYSLVLKRNFGYHRKQHSLTDIRKPYINTCVMQKISIPFLWLARLRASHYLILKRRYVVSVVRIFVKQRNRPEASTVSADCSHVFGTWKGISVTSYGR